MEGLNDIRCNSELVRNYISNWNINWDMEVLRMKIPQVEGKEAIEGRFKEIVSVQRIVDTETDIAYEGLVDTEFINLINKLIDNKQELKQRNDTTSKRFIIDCNGIIDTWNSTGKCEDKLTWTELCNTLNELDKIADAKLDNYEYTTQLEKENQKLKVQLVGTQALLHHIKNYIHDIDLLLEDIEDERI